MAKKSKVETATEADWSFTEDANAMKVISDVAGRLSFTYSDHLERGDVEQDGSLWLAVRPEVQERLRQGGSYREFYSHLWSGLSDLYAHRFQFTIAEFNEEIQ